MDAIDTTFAPLYDVIYGALLYHGRRSAIERLDPRPGESILEIGVGTGVDWHLSLDRLLAATNLTAVSVEAVNVPPVSSLVVCRRS